jgi:2-oxoacid:acceptor oxidoreductase gamma subunit (pyruvate/2-ketoisovalerate family)
MGQKIRGLWMIEVRFHGRGGQGAVTATRILANAFVQQGQFACSFPMFGFERRGAPVTAFMRFDERPIREKTQIYKPDCLVVLDSSQKNPLLVYEGLKPEGKLILNSAIAMREKPHKNLKWVGVVDAEAIALEELGRPSPNTCVLGGFSAATGWIGLEYVLSSLEQYFEGDILKNNKRAAERGYEEVQIVEW